MFISRAELTEIRERLDGLDNAVSQLFAHAMTANREVKKRPPMSKETRAKIGASMKALHARKKRGA